MVLVSRLDVSVDGIFTHVYIELAKSKGNWKWHLFMSLIATIFFKSSVNLVLIYAAGLPGYVTICA